MNEQIVINFIEAINDHDVDGILSLMAPDHVFIDTYGEVQTRYDMISGWKNYFKWFPDYLIEISYLIENKNVVGVFGYASGTFRGRKRPDNKNFWRLPAAWKAVVHNYKIKEWQVFCDSKIPYEIINSENQL